MLPCNVIVQERVGGQVEVSAVDPLASMQEKMTETKDATQSEAKDDTKPEALEEKPEAPSNADNPSTVSPEIVTRVHEFYEELGREDVKAVLKMDEMEQGKSKDMVEPKPKVIAKKKVDVKNKDNTKQQPTNKTKTKPDAKAGQQKEAKHKPGSADKK